MSRCSFRMLRVTRESYQISKNAKSQSEYAKGAEDSPGPKVTFCPIIFSCTEETSPSASKTIQRLIKGISNKRGFILVRNLIHHDSNIFYASALRHTLAPWRVLRESMSCSGRVGWGYHKRRTEVCLIILPF